MLVGADSTLYFRTNVCRLVIPIKTLAAATTATKPSTFTKDVYESEWQLFTLAAGFDGSAGKLVPYAAESAEGEFLAAQVDPTNPKLHAPPRSTPNPASTPPANPKIFMAPQVNTHYEDILLDILRHEVVNNGMLQSDHEMHGPTGFTDAAIVVRHGLTEVIRTVRVRTHRACK